MNKRKILKSFKENSKNNSSSQIKNLEREKNYFQKTGMNFQNKVSYRTIYNKISNSTARELIETENDLLRKANKHTIRIVEKNKKLILKNNRKDDVQSASLNIDYIATFFSNDEIVTIERLIKKGLAQKNTGELRITAHGILDKPLIVISDFFSLDAVKMITATGGRAILYSTDEWFF